MRRRVLLCGLCLAAIASLPGPAAAKGSLDKLEKEFEEAIKRVTPTTVVCIPHGVDPAKVGQGSSGVIVSRKGHVLSDGDVGVWYDVEKGKRVRPKDRRSSDDVDVRLPDPKGRGFKSYRARLLLRDAELDTSLLLMEKPPSSLKYLRIGDSDELQVGDFAFVMGNSFGLASEAAPTLTAGLISSLVPRERDPKKPDDPGGKWRHLYTSAAVNPGVNGGPLVDVHGLLVGTISNSVLWGARQEDDPELAYAYLGKVVPVERLKARYREHPDYDVVFPEKTKQGARSRQSSALSMVFHHTARRAYRSLVSLEFERKEELAREEPTQRGAMKIPRYLGPVSGVLISQDGYVLTSLYNLANLSTLHLGNWRRGPPPENVKVKHCVDCIQNVRVHLPDARIADAKVVAYHEGIGIALLKAETGGAAETGETVAGGGGAAGSTPAGTVTSYELLEAVPAEGYQSGRFVLALGNPFGARRLEDPLLTAGILAKQHAEVAVDPWAGQWQTDAGVTDGNCGGAAVDLSGRLLGILTIWSSTRHGRNSGIGFVIPWSQIEPVLGELKRGRTFRLPLFGITWAQLGGQNILVLETVSEGTAAHKAGLEPGDEFLMIDGAEVRTPEDVRGRLVGKYAGDEVLLKVKRKSEELDVKVVLGARE